MKRPLLTALFRGLGSSTQQAFCKGVYGHAMLATIVFSGIGIPIAHGNRPGVRLGQAGALMRNARSPFLGAGEMDPSVSCPQRLILSGDGRLYLSTPAPPANSIPPLAVSGKVWYAKVVSRPHKGLLFFVLWCPILQNHAVTAYAALFAVFEKMPISCGFAPSAYETFYTS